MQPLNTSTYPPPTVTEEDAEADILTPAANGDAEWWAYGTAGILTATALALLVFPRILLLLSVDEEPRSVLTPLETFLSIHLGLGLLSFSLSLLMGIPPSEAQVTPTVPQHPMLVPSTISMILSSIVSYNFGQVGAIGMITCVTSGIAGVWGLYVILFGGSSSISKTTGADKRTSTFLFGNKSAASAQKKQWKKEHKQK